MHVDAGLATLSDRLFVWAILLYSVALISYCGEYAFGRRGKVAVTADAPVAVAAGRSASEAPSARGPLSRAERFGRIAVAATAAGLALQLASLTTRGLATDRVPWGNMYEFSSVVGAAGVAAFLGVLVRLPQVRYLGMFLLMPVVLLLFLAGTVLYARAAPLVPALRSYWIVIHVTTIAIGTGIFLVSFVATVLYLVRRKWDLAVAAGRTPKRFPVTLGWRLPGAEVLDKMAYRTVAFGFPIYTFGIIAGAIWAEAAWGRYWGWDPKETWSFVAWVIYACYLHARSTPSVSRRITSWIAVAGWVAMLINLYGVNIFASSFHSYSGLK